MPASPPKITLFNAQISIFGQRVKILLHQLQVPFTEVIIPLDQPREPWYLAINPRGLVPALEVEDVASGKKQIAVESALICHFLLDLARGWDGEFAARAHAIFPGGHDLATATKRYNQAFFIDTYITKFQPTARALLRGKTEEAQQAFLEAAKEIDRICPQPGHYFADSDTITLVEVLTGPHVLRVDAFRRWGLAAHNSERLQAEAPRFYAWMKMLAADEGVKADSWDEEAQRKYAEEMIARVSTQAQK